MRKLFDWKIIFVFLLFFSSVDLTYAQSATMFFSNPPKQVEEGDRLTVDVRVRSTSQAINAVSGELSFPENLVSVASVSKERSIISLWIKEPRVARGRISFEGVALTPGFEGDNGVVFRITFEAKRSGVVNLNMTEGALLANDGLGTNILSSLGSTSFNIVPNIVFDTTTQNFSQEPETGKLVALPIITDYSPLVEDKGSAYLKGKGEPNAFTKIVFKDISFKSAGEKFIAFFQNKKKRLDEALVKNDVSGIFEYTSPKNLVAGVYNATPFLVDNSTNTEKPGLGVQLLISDSTVIKALVVVLNVLGLLIPIVLLGVIIYFIPWYSFKRTRVMKKRMGLEEERITLSEHQLERQDKISDKNLYNTTNSDPVDY